MANKELERAREFLLLLTKRRGQGKKPITDMVLWGMQQIEGLPSREDRYRVLDTLKEASEGKMFLEREYSQIVKQQAEMLEADGKAEEATKLVQEIQIETYGSLTTKEKVEFILYQMKLVLARRDFVRCQILSRKISKKHLNEKGLEGAKVRYYRFMVQYYVHERMTLDTAKAFQLIYDTLSANADELDPSNTERTPAFQNFIIFLMLSSHTNEKVDLLNIVAAKYGRELDVPATEAHLSKYLRRFLTSELMPFEAAAIEDSVKEFEPFNEGAMEHASTHLQEFLRQLIQHNIRTIQKYYSRIRLSRLAQLAGVSVELAEKELCDMVVKKTGVQAKINRMQGLVVFKKGSAIAGTAALTTEKDTNEALNEWNYDVRHMLEKIETTCHLINREKVVHNA